MSGFADTYSDDVFFDVDVVHAGAISSTEYSTHSCTSAQAHAIHTRINAHPAGAAVCEAAGDQHPRGGAMRPGGRGAAHDHEDSPP